MGRRPRAFAAMSMVCHLCLGSMGVFLPGCKERGTCVAKASGSDLVALPRSQEDGVPHSAAPARSLWDRVQAELPPLAFDVLEDAKVPSDTLPRTSLRRLVLRFTSQVIGGKRMDHTATLYLPADASSHEAASSREAPGRRGKVVVVGQRLWDASMLVNYGDSIASRTGYPTLVLPNPGELDGADGEGAWMALLRDLVRESRDPLHHNYFRLAVPYLRSLDILERILGEKEIRAVVGGHSKRATSAFLAAAIDPRRIVGLVYMGNETRFAPTRTPYLEPVTLLGNQGHVRCPVLYLGATNEDGYEMFNIARIQRVLDRPWTIEYIPNYRHATASEVQPVDWQMWVSHIFDGRAVTKISDLLCDRTREGNYFRARVETPNKVVQVKFWYVYSDDVPHWRDLVWYPLYPKPGERGFYDAHLEGRTPDAWFVEVKDTAGGIPGYVSSLPQDITGKPTKERVSRGWRSRHWDPLPSDDGRWVEASGTAGGRRGRDASEARFLELCDLAAAELQKEIVPFGDRENADPATHHMPFFEDAHAVRALAVAYDMTGEDRYLDACRRWSDRVIESQGRMIPRGAYYMNHSRAPGEDSGQWNVADSGSIGMGVLATAVRCDDPAERTRYLDSVRAFAGLVLESYVGPEGGITNGLWPAYSGQWWCSTATFGTLAFLLHAATGEERYLHVARGAIEWMARRDFREVGPITFAERPSGIIFYCFELYAVGLERLDPESPAYRAVLGQIDGAIDWMAANQKTRGADVPDYLVRNVDMAGLPYLQYAFSRKLPRYADLAERADRELRYIGDILLAQGKPQVSRLMTWEVMTWGMMSFAEKLRPGGLERGGR